MFDFQQYHFAFYFETLIQSHLSRCSTARRSGFGLSLVGPTKVKAHKCFLFTEGFLKVENKPGGHESSYFILMISPY